MISQDAFYMSVVAALLNIGGNLFNVLILDMGLAGIALSTVTSALVVTACYFFKLVKIFSQLPIEQGEKGKFKVSFACVRKSLRYSVPVSCQQGVMYFSGLVISPMINVLGAAATTGYAVSNRFFAICAQIYQNSAKAVSTYTAQGIGAKKYDSIQKGLYVGLVQSVLFTLPFVIVCALFTPALASVFFSGGYSGEALDIAVRFGRIYLPFVMLNLINNLAHSFFRGMGSMKYLFISTLIGSVSRIIATLCLVGKLGIDGIFLGWVISWGVEMIYCLSVYFLYFHREDSLLKQIHKFDKK